MSSRAARSSILLLILLAILGGCSRSPEARKARHLERGEKYFSRQQYREAIIEYRNVLQIDAANRGAIRQLGLSLVQLGEVSAALPFLLKSAELDPERLDVRAKLGAVYLVGRRFDQASAEAAYVLERDPRNLEALLVLAGATRTSEEIDAAIRRLDEARPSLGNDAKLYVALGILYLRNQDPTQAETTFKEALSREPKSIEAHTALGDFYVMKSDLVQAEREYQAGADLATVDSLARIKLADFYYRVAHKPEDAKRVLTEISAKATDSLRAQRRLAEISFAQERYDETLKTLDGILKKNPSDLAAHVLRGRVHLAKGEPTEAIQEFQHALKLEPGSAEARYYVAIAYLKGGNREQARAEFKQATTLAPDFRDAVLALAQLNIQSGAVRPAIEDLETFVLKRPNEPGAYALLGSAYLANREPVKATETYRKITALAPKEARGPYLVGLALQAQGRRAEAKKEFEAALSLAPGFVEPLANLTAMSMAEKAPDVALERVKQQIVRVPASGALQDLLGRVYLARGEPAPAETALRKALALQPDLVDSYLTLGELYVKSGKYDQALAELNTALGRNPSNLFALMLSGSVHEVKGDIPRAQVAYEKVLAVAPRFAPAANNLAYLYSEHGGDQEKALQLAQTAKEVAPDDPRISDTLGWILYKRGVYQRALGELQESASKLADNPEVQYHLGLTYYKLGNMAGAKQALGKALKLRSRFPGSEEARQVLAGLK